MRRCDDRFGRGVAKIDDALLVIGHFFRRRFNAEVAARYHDAIADAYDFFDIFQRLAHFDLGDNGGAFAQALHQSLQFLNIIGGADK